PLTGEKCSLTCYRWTAIPWTTSGRAAHAPRRSTPLDPGGDVMERFRFWPGTWQRWTIPLVVTLCFLAAVGVSVGSFPRGQRPQGAAAGAAPPPALPAGPRDAPLRLTPTVQLPGMLDPAGVRRAVSRLWKESPTSMSETLHVVRLFGADAAWRNPEA